MISWLARKTQKVADNRPEETSLYKIARPQNFGSNHKGPPSSTLEGFSTSFQGGVKVFSFVECDNSVAQELF